MTFAEYQKAAKDFDVFSREGFVPCDDPAHMSKLLGLVGEAGEVAERYKKALRDDPSRVSPEAREDLTKELGDVLWYLATLARYLDISFEDIASTNIDKLTARKAKNKIHDDGSKDR